MAHLCASSPDAPLGISEVSEHGVEENVIAHVGCSCVCRGKAPPVDTFIGEDPECHPDDWLSTLKRAADRNDWTRGDLLIQFAGHLKGMALQEWNLLPQCEKETYEMATGALRSRLDPGSKIMVVQDFCHTSQEENEKVGDFIHWLEQLFKLAYGHDAISAET